MKKILIISDTHGKTDRLKTVLEKMGPIDHCIHLGDAEGTELSISYMLPEGCGFDIVRGNCDYTALPSEKIITIGKYKIFLTHGHRYHVNITNETLAQAAKNAGCQIAMYGHTHVPEITECEGVTILNPGSLSKPRQGNRNPSYIQMELDRDGEAHFTISYITDAWKEMCL